jgi:hypothetical protein
MKDIQQLNKKELFFEYDGQKYHTKPIGESWTQFLKSNVEEQQIMDDDKGYLEALRFGDEITNEEYWN